MTPFEFAKKWQGAALTERAAYQQHFLDLCQLLGQPAPAQADPTGERYAFEKGVTKTSGAKGFADVWMRGHFAIEYKGRHKDLKAAYQQLLTYREDLENPPLLVVCDLNRFEVHTNFTGTVKAVYAFDLSDLAAGEPTPASPRPPLSVLRALFENPDLLRPERTSAQVTEEAARAFGELARALTARGEEPHAVAHFLIRLLFCLFAEDIGLLPAGLFTRLLLNLGAEPARFGRGVRQLFAAMATGGEFGPDRIAHFNGGLFDDGEALELTQGELSTLSLAASLDWGEVEPSIFGTLFERSLDPKKRSQLGAHYTSRGDIDLIVEPVVMAPLRRRWEQVRQRADALLAERAALIGEQEAKGAHLTPLARQGLVRRRGEKEGSLLRLLQDFTEEISSVRVLDPACGSGNFLYVSLRSLLSLEKQVIAYATGQGGLSGFFPRVAPEQMRGIELSEYAAELAAVTVWIGYIQWLRANGFGYPEEPILRRFEMVQEQDALLSEGGTEAVWPEADYIVGNPPFLGDKKMRAELGDGYVERLRALYGGRVPGGADLVCYWFEKARALIAAGKVKCAGLLCTNSIRYGASREVLERIQATGDIFMAWSDREWILEGAAVRVSIVGFDDGSERARMLDGAPVARINADLSSRPDVTTARFLKENSGFVFMGDTKGGAFDIPSDVARQLLAAVGNPNGRPNSEVVKPWINGLDITRRKRDMWIIDFGTMNEADAALYEAPFEYVLRYVKPEREGNNRASYREKWWIHMEPRPAMWAALKPLPRCIVTPEVAKHRVFAWMPTTTVPDHACHVFARDDDYFFGVLHSRIHEVWSLAVGNRMGMGNDPRYNSSKTFGTFPLPWSPGREPTEDDSPTVKAVAEAARRLVELRDRWLNPEGMDAAELKKRTLTSLYNARPTWLAKAHAALDGAVCAAYAEATGEAWPIEMSEAELLGRLLSLNHQRAGRAAP